MKVLGALTLTSLGTAAAWLTGTDTHAALTGLPGETAWHQAGGLDLRSTPQQVRTYFTTLTGTQRTTLVNRAPGVVGNLDGVPYELRYRANAKFIEKTPGKLLAYDPRGDGRAVEVFGDLNRARHIAVLVPGTGWNVKKLLAGDGPKSPAVQAQRLRAEMSRLDPSAETAVVVWLGYDAPEGIDMQTVESGRAAAGARPLQRFVEQLPAKAHVSLLCHSYGSVVCGRAVAAGTKVGDLVAIASPGMDVSSAGKLRGAARVWAARDTDDPIAFTPFVRVAGLGHGDDPVAGDYGARVIATGTAHGHGGYYIPGTESLTNLARIALGRASEVTLNA